MIGDSFIYMHRGYTYLNWKDYEDDNVKIFHEVYDNNNKYVCHFPYSPYGTPTPGLFAKWIDMGMPSRELMGGNYRQNHENYYNKWVNNQIDKMLVEEMTDAL